MTNLRKTSEPTSAELLSEAEKLIAEKNPAQEKLNSIFASFVQQNETSLIQKAKFFYVIAIGYYKLDAFQKAETYFKIANGYFSQMSQQELDLLKKETENNSAYQLPSHMETEYDTESKNLLSLIKSTSSGYVAQLQKLDIDAETALIILIKHSAWKEANKLLNDNDFWNELKEFFLSKNSKDSNSVSWILFENLFSVHTEKENLAVKDILKTLLSRGVNPFSPDSNDQSLFLLLFKNNPTLADEVIKMFSETNKEEKTPSSYRVGKNLGALLVQLAENQDWETALKLLKSAHPIRQIQTDFPFPKSADCFLEALLQSKQFSGDSLKKNSDRFNELINSYLEKIKNNFKALKGAETLLQPYRTHRNTVNRLMKNLFDAQNNIKKQELDSSPPLSKFNFPKVDQPNNKLPPIKLFAKETPTTSVNTSTKEKKDKPSIPKKT